MSTDVPLPEPSAYAPQMITEDAYTADQLRAYGDARAAEARATHAKELVEAHREAFVGNIQAVSKLGLDAMDAQPLLLAVQNWGISTGRARELLRCWVLGTFKPDMLPECGDELFSETEEPREAFAKLQAEVAALRKALKPFADADLTSPVVRDTFGFDVLRARAALQEQKS